MRAEPTPAGPTPAAPMERAAAPEVQMVAGAIPAQPTAAAKMAALAMAA